MRRRCLPTSIQVSGTPWIPCATRIAWRNFGVPAVHHGKYGKLMVVTDFLVIGGGVIGINIARNLKNQFTDSKITLIEKEPQCGLHASGRNSGVLHAGFYYSADSLKARFPSEGNKALTEYCEKRNIKIN